MKNNNFQQIYKNTFLFSFLGIMFYIANLSIVAFVMWVVAYSSIPVIKMVSDKNNNSIKKQTVKIATLVTNATMTFFIFLTIKSFIQKEYFAGVVSIAILLYLWSCLYYFIKKGKSEPIEKKTNFQKYEEIKREIIVEQPNRTASSPESLVYNILYEKVEQTDWVAELPKPNPHIVHPKAETKATEQERYIHAQSMEELQLKIKNLHTQPFVKAELNSVIRYLERIKVNNTFGKPLHFIFYGNDKEGKQFMANIISDLFWLNGMTKSQEPVYLSIDAFSDKQVENVSSKIQSVLSVNKQSLLVVSQIDYKNRNAEATLRLLINELNANQNTTLILTVNDSDINNLESITQRNRNVQFRKMQFADTSSFSINI